MTTIPGNEPVEQLIENALHEARSGDVEIPSNEGVENAQLFREMNEGNVNQIEWVDDGYVVHGEGSVKEMVERIPDTRRNPPEDVFRQRGFKFTIYVPLTPKRDAETHVEYL